MATDSWPGEVSSPGNYLREMLQERGWTQDDLATIIGRDQGTVNQLITGRRSVTPETAVLLASAFATSADFWLHLDSAYQLSRHGANRQDDVAKRARLFTIAPVKDMIRRGWIQSSDATDDLEHELLVFFQTDTLADPPAFTHAARKSTPYDNVTPAQRAWLFRCRWVSRYAHASKFSRRKLPLAMSQLKDLMYSPQEIRHIPKVLGNAGIRLVVVEHLPGTRIDGATFWLEDGPVIALSVRYNRIDHFWFTLLHELGHIEQNTSSMDVDVDPVVDDIPEEEQLANAFAADHAVPRAALDSFIARVGPIYNMTRIKGFAHVHGVHAGIVVGQLHHRQQIAWSNYRRLLVPIRAYATESAVTDGWGSPFPVAAN